METFVTVVHVITALFIIGIVLVQGGNAGGIGAAFGGGNNQGFFGASGATSFFGKLTYVFAGIFMITSISLSVIQSESGKTGLGERLKGAQQQEAPPAEDAQKTDKDQ